MAVCSIHRQSQKKDSFYHGPPFGTSKTFKSSYIIFITTAFTIKRLFKDAFNLDSRTAKATRHNASVIVTFRTKTILTDILVIKRDQTSRDITSSTCSAKNRYNVREFTDGSS